MPQIPAVEKINTRPGEGYSYFLFKQLLERLSSTIMSDFPMTKMARNLVGRHQLPDAITKHNGGLRTGTSNAAIESITPPPTSNSPTSGSKTAEARDVIQENSLIQLTIYGTYILNLLSFFSDYEKAAQEVNRKLAEECGSRRDENDKLSETVRTLNDDLDFVKRDLDHTARERDSFRRERDDMRALHEKTVRDMKDENMRLMAELARMTELLKSKDEALVCY